MNITRTVKNKLCIGCGTCASFCPKDCIELCFEFNKGLFIPNINKNKCINCKKCYKICISQNLNFNELNTEIFGEIPTDYFMGNYLANYVGFSEDDKIRFNSSSGGIVTQILIYALEKGIIDGALVTRMSDENPLKPEPFIARSKKEIIEASKSKYCPVPLNLALKEILDSGDEKFAVVGLPCHIQGIRLAEKFDNKLKQNIIMHIGLFCGGVQSFLATKFLLRQMKISKSNITSFSYRGNGWPGKLSLNLKDGKKFSLKYPDYWWGFGSFFYPLRCSLCLDWTSELADISIGDAWISEIIQNDNIGTSVFIARKEFIIKILDEMACEGIISKDFIDRNQIISSQKGIKWKKIDSNVRNRLLSFFRKEILFNPNPPVNYSFIHYFKAFTYYFKMYIFSNPKLWIFLDIYIFFINRLKLFKSK